VTDFYTNVQCVGDYILYRGVVNGRRVSKKVEYSPSVFVLSKKTTDFKNLKGEFLEEIKPGGIRDCKDYLKKFDDVSGMKIYGSTKFEYNYISDLFKDDIDWDQSLIRIASIDIEVGSENGFPNPDSASEPITAICMKFLGHPAVVFGCGDYKVTGSEIYIKCVDEYTLCKKFLRYWCDNYPDIITGWNIKFFDFPYIINRLGKLLGETEVRKLSPWNNIRTNTANFWGKENTVYTMLGVPVLDYLELYRRYQPGGNSQESYKLDAIAQVEGVGEKLSYEEYGDLHSLYRLNYQKFIEYNIQDVMLIERLEDKCKLLELALTLAYDSKTNFDDVFSQVRMWDVLIYNHLKKQNIQIPPKTTSQKDVAYEGAYVKDPQIGMHEWVASFDLNSLYPHLIMQYNISPETLFEPEDYTHGMRDIVLDGVTVNKLLSQSINTSALSDNKVTLTPNGQFFRVDKLGFLPAMMQEMYDDRVIFKKKSIESKKDLEKETDPKARFEIEKRIARYNNLQLAKKVCLNSAYGALGNQYFRFFDTRQAEGVTLAGQLSIRWIENSLNEYMNKLLRTNGVDYVIASDTDSIYLRLSELVKQSYGKIEDKNKVISFMDKVCENKIQPFIDKSYTALAQYLNAYDQKMQMKREALSDKGIWTAKKRYILNVYNNEGVQYTEPKMKVMGLEMVKSSTPAPIRIKMAEAIKLMMNGTESDLHTFIDDFKSVFKTLPVEDISFPRGMNGITSYAGVSELYKKGTPIHVKGAIIYNDLIKQKSLIKKYPLIQEGEKIRFVYLKSPNPVKDTVISFPASSNLPKEFELQKYVDYDIQFKKAFIDPIQIVLSCIGWNSEKTNSLEDFFS